MSGAVLFLDVSDFTPLTERFASRGGAGLEKLSDLINRYFHELMTCVREHDGDVVQFFGDALLVLFADAPGEPAGSVSVQGALHCALEIRDRFHHYPTGEERHRLGLKITVGSGELHACEVHAPGTARQVVVYGHAMSQLVGLASSDLPGEIALSQPTVERIQQGEFELRTRSPATLLVRANRPPVPRPASSRPGRDMPFEALQPYVPPLRIDLIASKDVDWLAQFRPVTSLLFQIRGADAENPSPEELQRLFAAIAAPVVKHGGLIFSFAVEDKGVVMTCAFGVPGSAHTDDPDRAVRAAFEALEGLGQANYEARAGCATGLQFCGLLGDAERSQFALLGKAVNLAARLSGTDCRHLLVDEVTAAAVRGTGISMQVLPPLVLKGFAEPVVASLCFEDPYRSEACPGLAGRAREKEALEQAYRSSTSGASRCLVLEGEPGIGKSRLIEHLRRHVTDAGATCLVGTANEVEQDVPYNAWRSIMQHELAQPFPDDPQELTAVVARKWPDTIVNALPLLAEVLHLPIPDNETTRELKGEIRTRATERAITQIISTQARAAHLVLVLEDVHWLDSASWALLPALLKAELPLLVVLTMRAGERVEDINYERLVRRLSVERIRLDVLSRAESRELLTGLLGGIAVSPQLLDEIHDRANGHPFLTEESFFGLRERGLLRIHQGVCELASLLTDTSEFAPAGAIVFAVNSRVDRLSAHEQLTLKVASAIGQTVPESLLDVVMAAVGSEHGIADAVRVLCEFQFLYRHPSGGQLSFRHAIIRDAVYGMMTYAQRERVHGVIAEAYEGGHGFQRGGLAAVVAHHYASARMMTQAVVHYESAAKHALRVGANREAVLHAASARLLVRENRIEVGTTRLAEWERLRGEAEFQRGHLKRSREHFEDALRLLDPGWTMTTAHAVRDILRCSANQVVRRVTRRRMAVASMSTDHERARSTALYSRVIARITRLHFFAGRGVEFLRATLLTLDSSERISPSPELATAYAGVSLISSLLLRGTALPLVYERLAYEACDLLQRRLVRADVNFIIGARLTGEGRWEEAYRRANDALETFQSVNDPQYTGHCLALLIDIAMFSGSAGDAAGYSTQLQRIASTSDNSQLQLWNVTAKAWLNRRLGFDAEIMRVAGQLDSMQMPEGEEAEPFMVVWLRANIAFAFARSGNATEAEEYANLAMPSDRGRRSPVFWEFDPWLCLAETYALLWEHAGEETGRSLYDTKLGHCVRSLGQLARFVPIARPAHLLACGLHRARLGKRAAARVAWKKAARTADALRMPYEAGRAYHEMARSAGLRSDVDRNRALALERFEEAGAQLDAKQVSTLAS